MKDVNVSNLQNIFDRIDSGELHHNQSKYFCGTACCIAGWDVALNFPDTYQEFIEGDSVEKLFNAITVSPGEWSQSNNNLTNPEACILFDSDVTREVQDAAMRALTRGERLTLDEIAAIYIDEAECTKFPVILVGSNRDLEAVGKFLTFDPDEVQVTLEFNRLVYTKGSRIILAIELDS